jgi:hypothetical protein
LQSQEDKVDEVTAKRAELLALSRLPDEAGGSAAKRTKASAKLKAQLPFMAKYPTTALGAVSEAFCDSLLDFIGSNPNGVLSVKGAAIRNNLADLGGKERTAKRKAAKEAKDMFMRLMQLKFMRCQVAAGEAVGVLAAQSVGESELVLTFPPTSVLSPHEFRTDQSIPVYSLPTHSLLWSIQSINPTQASPALR